MARELTAGEIAAVTSLAVQPIHFVELFWPSSTVRLHSGVGDFVMGGNTYMGAGDLGSVSGVEESTDGTAPTMTLGINGIPTDNVAAILADKYQGRRAVVYLGFLKPDGTLIKDPALVVFAGKIAQAQHTLGGDSCSISIVIESSMARLKQSADRRYTHEDQQISHPGDLSLEYIAACNTDIPDNWGVPGSAYSSRRGSVSQKYLM